MTVEIVQGDARAVLAGKQNDGSRKAAKAPRTANECQGQECPLLCRPRLRRVNFAPLRLCVRLPLCPFEPGGLT